MKRLTFQFPELLTLLKVSLVGHGVAFIIMLYMHTPSGAAYFTWAVIGERALRQWLVFLWVFQHGLMGGIAYHLWHPVEKWLPWIMRVGRGGAFGILFGVYFLCVAICMSLGTLTTLILATYYQVPWGFMGDFMGALFAWSVIVGLGMGLFSRPMLWISLSALQIILFWLEPDLSVLSGWWPLFYLTPLEAPSPSLWQLGTFLMGGAWTLYEVVHKKDVI